MKPAFPGSGVLTSPTSSWRNALGADVHHGAWRGQTAWHLPMLAWLLDRRLRKSPDIRTNSERACPTNRRYSSCSIFRSMCTETIQRKRA